MKQLVVLILFFFLPSVCKADKVIKLFDNTFFVETSEVGSITAKGIHATASAEPNLRSLVVSVEGNSIRYWTDGTIPATNTGHLVVSGDYILVEGISNCTNFKYISLTTSTVSLSYGRK